jgi:serine/threonine-protein kinase
MGEVYRAEDLKLGQAVALKFLPQAVPETLRRFYSEVRLGRQVAHPNVCRIYDVAEADGRHFLSMELVDGEDLSSLLRRIGRLAPDRALEVSRQLCAGLAAAHDKGVLHRDLKPANIMIDGRGHVRITDFGLAVLASEAMSGGVVAGTPAYMSPEQLAGADVSIRSDLFALGLVFYEIFTGKRLVTAGSRAELAAQHAALVAPNMRRLVPGIDAEIERVIAHCLEPRPEGRPASARAVLAALPGGDAIDAAIAAGETPSPEIVAAAAESGALSRRIAWVCLLSSLALLVGAIHSSSVPLPKPPAVLTERARQIASLAGYQVAPVDEADGFVADWDYWNWLQRDRPDLREDPEMRAAGYRFFYRESPRPLAAHDLLDGLPWEVGLRAIGVVTMTNPPSDVSGMVDVVLDRNGRLLRLTGVPPQVRAGGTRPTAAVDWSALLAETDVARGSLATASPEWAAPVDSDRKEAWTGTLSRLPRTPVRVEAASHGGKPVYLDVQGPWTRPDRVGPLRTWDTPALRTALWTLLALVLLVLIGGGGLVRRNLLRRRADARGAVRLGIAALLSLSVAHLARAHHVSSLFLETHLFERVLSQAVFGAVVLVALYLALEPVVRRRWPRTLTSWHRLVRGEVRNPMVGRDVLVGALTGLVALFVGPYSLGSHGDLGVVSQPRALAFEFLASPYRAVLFSMTLLLGSVLFHSLVRSRWLATGLACLPVFVAALGPSPGSFREPAAAVVMTGIVMFVLVRYGLLALTAFWFFMRVTDGLPPVQDVSAWYAGTTMVGGAVVAALVGWAFLISLGGRPLFGEMLDD